VTTKEAQKIIKEVIPEDKLDYVYLFKQVKK